MTELERTFNIEMRYIRMLKDEYSTLFTDDEKKLCKDRLKEFGYKTDDTKNEVNSYD